MIAYPSIDTYKEAFQNLSTSFVDPEIKTGIVSTNKMGLPIILSGNFALTINISLNSGKNCAVRCLHRYVPDIESRYAAISKCLSNIQEYFVSFEFQNNGVKIDNCYYPVIKMDWAEGITLGHYIEQNYSKPQRLKWLRKEFLDLYDFLKRNNIAHGDLQNGNILINSQGIKLVDYDGMYVPGMNLNKSNEIGHPDFQHPERKNSNFNSSLDEFSFMVLDLSLCALTKKPELFPRYSAQENIIFKKEDFLYPDSSILFRELQTISDIKKDVKNFIKICKADYIKIPTFKDFLEGKNIPVSTIMRFKSPSRQKNKFSQLINDVLKNINSIKNLLPFLFVCLMFLFSKVKNPKPLIKNFLTLLIICCYLLFSYINSYFKPSIENFPRPKQKTSIYYGINKPVHYTVKEIKHNFSRKIIKYPVKINASNQRKIKNFPKRLKQKFSEKYEIQKTEDLILY